MFYSRMILSDTVSKIDDKLQERNIKLIKYLDNEIADIVTNSINSARKCHYNFVS